MRCLGSWGLVLIVGLGAQGLFVFIFFIFNVFVGILIMLLVVVASVHGILESTATEAF